MKRFLPKATPSGTTNSYLGGVFNLLENEAIFVKVNNHTVVILHQLAENYTLVLLWYKMSKDCLHIQCVLVFKCM